MKIVLVWMLITTARVGDWSDAMPTYSPYVATLEDCTRLLSSVAGKGVDSKQCVQVKVLVKD